MKILVVETSSFADERASFGQYAEVVLGEYSQPGCHRVVSLPPRHPKGNNKQSRAKRAPFSRPKGGHAEGIVTDRRRREIHRGNFAVSGTPILRDWRAARDGPREFIDSAINDATHLVLYLKPTKDYSDFETLRREYEALEAGDPIDPWAQLIVIPKSFFNIPLSCTPWDEFCNFVLTKL